MMRAICLLAILMVVACQGVATEQHLVTYVVDGDTIYVEGLKSSIRVRNVDAYELGTEKGELAKEFVEVWVLGKLVELDCDGRDRFDRHLCFVVVGGFDLGNDLVSIGLARPWIER